MITEDFVIIPLEARQLVPYGIGSVRIRKDGSMDFIAPSGNEFGKTVQAKFREGSLTALRLEMVEPPILCGETSPKDGQPCVFPRGHRFEGINYCASQAEIDASE